MTNKSTIGVRNYQTEFFHLNKNDKKIYHMCDELSNKLLTS